MCMCLGGGAGVSGVSSVFGVSYELTIGVNVALMEYRTALGVTPPSPEIEILSTAGEENVLLLLCD